MMEKICAISTPAGVGGIAVLRLSGEGVKEFVEKFLVRQSDSRKVSLRSRMATFCTLSDGEDLIDEVVVTYFQAPHSYTGEDVVEISCHGSLYVQQRLLQLFIDNGARLAEPGEFTMRAFLNGRMDLSQAEAVADLIDSRSESAHRLAISQMRGGYAKELENLRQELIDLAALLELELDFSDEDVEFANRQRLQDTLNVLSGKVQR
ncbi:MAG: tRNA uridine-5-carboxymethylaminomethyl(34) synthesis GTPase MnmE, partial [Bacteroidales bacterium]|nr:tRNA uridine-5-carboxymethylaminomethyl(34) synthesis GTPase MnmE [Bacteroidales bacterium]